MYIHLLKTKKSFSFFWGLILLACTTTTTHVSVNISEEDLSYSSHLSEPLDFEIKNIDQASQAGNQASQAGNQASQAGNQASQAGNQASQAGNQADMLLESLEDLAIGDFNMIDISDACMTVDESCNQIDDDCDGVIDEALNVIGEWQPCQFNDSCVLLGNQIRNISTCIQGELIENIENQACQRETDELIVSVGDWGNCGEFSNDCDESGLRRRINQICLGGMVSPKEESEPCSRNTDGDIVSVGNWSSCGGFSSSCDESGTQSKTSRVCRNGSAVNESTSRNCSRNTDGHVVSTGSWGSCTSFLNMCDESGTQSKTDRICSNGSTVNQVSTQACSRETEFLSCGLNLCCIHGTCMRANCAI